MKFCQRHWDALRAAIESRGLGHLIASNGREAHARMVSDVQGTSDLSDFDPLMSAHWQIMTRALDVLGFAALNDGCPVCLLVDATDAPPAGHPYPTNELFYIDGPADAHLAYAKEHGIDKPMRAEP